MMTNREKYIDGILALHSWTVVDGKSFAAAMCRVKGVYFITKRHRVLHQKNNG